MQTLTVFTPAYNRAHTIGRTYKSLCSQKCKDFVWLIVDDGSTDSSAKIIDDYADLHMRCNQDFTYQKQRCVGCKNERCLAAKGDWIGFTDGDDVIEPDMYERLFDNAQKYNADISHCGYQMVFSDGRINYFHNTDKIRIQDKETGIKDLLDGSIVEPGLWNKLYKSSLFSEFF